MNVLKFGGALAVLAGVYGWNQVQSHAAFNDAVNRYNLQPAQVTVMRSCIASMSRHRRKFKRGAKGKPAAPASPNTRPASSTTTNTRQRATSSRLL